jgi:hypothetical protein
VFSEAVGAYSTAWVDYRTFVLTVTDTQGLSPGPRVGYLTVSLGPWSGADVRAFGNVSSAVNGTSPVLDGNCGLSFLQIV